MIASTLFTGILILVIIELLVLEEQLPVGRGVR